MAQIDQVMARMSQDKMSRAILCSDAPMRFFVGERELIGPQLSFAQLQNVVHESAPTAQKPLVKQNGTFDFPIQSPYGDFEITVTRDDRSLKVEVFCPACVPVEIAQPSAGSFTKLTNEKHEADSAMQNSSEETPTDNEAPAEKTSSEKQAVTHMDDLFALMMNMDASDLHLSSGETPMARVQGVMKRLNEYSILQSQDLKKLLFEITPTRNREQWEAEHDTDFSYELKGEARFRCNIFKDRRGIGGVFRLIPSKIKTVKELGLSPAMIDFCSLSKGLIVVTGPSGSGKSTTLAALIDYINKHREDHIVTVEDPVEFVHSNIKCLVNQREVHVDTQSFARALRASLREDPDIILVGEMRDLETTKLAIEAAETGHLVFGTLHTSSAASTVDRIIDQFPSEEQAQVRVMLAETLKGVVAQTLLRTKDGQRVVAFELLLVPPAVSNLIREGKTFQLPSQMQMGKSQGMMSMNDSILAHVKSGRVDAQEGYMKALDKAGLLSSYETNDIPLPVAKE